MGRPDRPIEDGFGAVDVATMARRATRIGAVALVATLWGTTVAAAPAVAATGGSRVGTAVAAQGGFGAPSAPMDAIVALQAEVLVLVELGALPNPPPRLVAIHGEYASFVTGLDRGSLINWLRASDADGARALAQLRAQGYVMRSETMQALASLSPTAYAAIGSNGTVDVPPSAYVAALDDLDVLAASGPATPTTLPPTTTPATVGPVPTAPPTTVPVPTAPPTTAPTPVPSTAPPTPTPAASAGLPAASGTPVLPAGAAAGSGGPAEGTPTSAPTTTATVANGTTGGSTPTTSTTSGSLPAGASADDDVATGDRTDQRADEAGTAASGDEAGTAGGRRPSGGALAVLTALGVLLVALVGGLGVRARRRRAVAGGDVDAVLEAGRRLATMLDLTELHRGMLGETRAALGAEHAAFVACGGDGGRSSDTEDGTPRPGTEASRAVERVADTGLSWRGAVAWHDDGRPAVSTVATAVTTGGQVRGVLVARRPASRAFQAAEQVRLERLAPLVAAALAAATRHEELTALTFTDGLTKLANRRQLDEHLSAARNVAGEETVGFIMIDVDHFKTYNDTHGHPAGDELLRQLAELLAASVRPRDVVYRYGGEEFAVLLPGADERAAADVGERIRRAVHDADLAGGASQPGGRVTVSVGVAVGTPAEAEDLKGYADRSLYRAKHDGRNRVVVGRPEAD